MAYAQLRPIIRSVGPNSMITAIVGADGAPPVRGKGGDIPAKNILFERSPTGAQ
jgi:hypothetical protein